MMDGTEWLSVGQHRGMILQMLLNADLITVGECGSDGCW